VKIKSWSEGFRSIKRHVSGGAQAQVQAGKTSSQPDLRSSEPVGSLATPDPKKDSAVQTEPVASQVPEIAAVSQQIRDLSAIIIGMSEKIAHLESLLKQSHVSDGGKQPVMHPTDTRDRSYSEVLQASPATTSGPKSVPKPPGTSPIRRKEEKTKKNANDVIRQNDVGSNVTSGLLESKQEVRHAEENDLPRVAILADSVLKGVQPKRLGRGYGVAVSVRSAYSSDEIPEKLQAAVEESSKPLEGIVIHCGVNDIKKKDAKSASTSFVNMIRMVRKKVPNAKIVVSKIAPVKNAELSMKRELFNATVASDLYGMENVSFVTHSNLNPWYLKQDGIHPNMRGNGVLAGNLGRHLRGLFWVLPKKTARPTSRSVHPPYNPWWDNIYNVLHGY